MPRNSQSRFPYVGLGRRCHLLVFRAFRHILQADRDKHGSNDYTLDDTAVDAFQEDVDGVIEATTIDRATTAGEEDVGA